MSRYSLLLSFLIVVAIVCPALSSFVLHNFDTNGVDNWKGLTLSTEQAHSGSHSGCWANTSSPTSISFNLTKVKSDWSAFTLFSMWVYSTKADNSEYQVVLRSENASSQGEDYYSFKLTLDWEGWREVKRAIPAGWGTSRYPLGWNKLTSFNIYASGWSHTPTGTKMYLDDLSLSYVPPSFVEKVNMSGALVPGFDTRFYVPIKGLATNNKVTTLVATISKGSKYIQSAVWEDTNKSITTKRSFTPKNDEYLFFNAKLTPNKSASSEKEKDIQIDFCMTIAEGSEEDKNCWYFVGKFNPNPAAVLKDHPYVLFSKTEIENLQKERSKKVWVDNQLKTIEGYAKSYINYNFTFPTGISRWSGYYVCNDGTSLTFNVSSPLAHYCPSDKKYYTGEPYNGGWITKMHSTIATNTYRLALNYLLNKNSTILERLRNYFIEYSNNYQTYPYHGTKGTDEYFATSGGRLMPQTLDESEITVKIIVTYDIIYEDLTREERAYIEYNFLRPLYTTIKRQNSKESNWQSWHNAAMTGVGVVLNDKEMVEYAIDGATNGFKFQMNASVGDDGIWYEQSMGYHYYALSALQSNAQYAKCMGYDLFHYTTPMSTVPGGKKGLKDMYMGPIHLMMPNYNVPGINDGGEQSLTSNVDYFEVAYELYPEERDILGWALCTFLANRTRNSIYAMKYGHELPDWCTSKGPTDDVKSPLKSEYLEASGAAILRTDGDYLFYENGPHGGWHGHYDKLGIVFYTHKTELVRDYGSLAYRLPMHNNYFKRTLSHSAPMLDGICQTESNASGPAVVDGSMGDVQISKLTTVPLNDANRLRRTMFLIADDDDSSNSEYPILLDIAEAIIENETGASDRFFDLITHSESTQYSLDYSNGTAVSVSAVKESMGSDVAWQYLTSLKKTESKEAMTGVWDWGHSVRQQFDRTDEWNGNGLELSTLHVQLGKYSLRWKDHTSTTSISAKKYMTDWTDVENITLTLYNAVINTEKLYLIIYSENATSSGIDYYQYVIPLNWKGWKTYNLTKKDFGKARYPVGWNAITGITFSANWGNTQNATSDLFFDSMQFWRKDGTEIDGFKGLEQYLPKVSHERKTFYDLDAPSNPTSKRHAVSIIRQNAKDPIVQLLRPHTETNFVSSFAKSGKSYVIKTKAETITVNLGDTDSVYPCATVTRKSSKKGTTTTYLGCDKIDLVDPNMNLTVTFFPREGSVVSLQTGESAPEYNATSNSVVFNNVKVTGNKEIGINITTCSRGEIGGVIINGQSADVVEKTTTLDAGCIMKSLSINLNTNPSVMGSVIVNLDDDSISSASYTQCSCILLFVLLLLISVTMH